MEARIQTLVDRIARLHHIDTKSELLSSKETEQVNRIKSVVSYADFNRGKLSRNGLPSVPCDQIYLTQLIHDFLSILRCFFIAQEFDRGFLRRLRCSVAKNVPHIFAECRRLKYSPELFLSESTRVTFLSTIAALAQGLSAINRAFKDLDDKHDKSIQLIENRLQHEPGRHSRHLHTPQGRLQADEPVASYKRGSWKYWLQSAGSGWGEHGQDDDQYAVRVPPVGVAIHKKIKDSLLAMEGDFQEKKKIAREGPWNSEREDMQELARATGLDYTLLHEAEIDEADMLQADEGVVKDYRAYDWEGIVLDESDDLVWQARLLRHNSIRGDDQAAARMTNNGYLITL